jgi:hypothetical protein
MFHHARKCPYTHSLNMARASSEQDPTRFLLPADTNHHLSSLTSYTYEYSVPLPPLLPVHLRLSCEVLVSFLCGSWSRNSSEAGIPLTARPIGTPHGPQLQLLAC